MALFFYVDFFPGKNFPRIKFSFFQIFGGIDYLKVYRPKLQVDSKLFSSMLFKIFFRRNQFDIKKNLVKNNLDSDIYWQGGGGGGSGTDDQTSRSTVL